MRKALRAIAVVAVVLFAIIGVLAVLLIIFAPKSSPSKQLPALAVLAPTVTPTALAPTPKPLPTPDANAVYRSQMLPWLHDVEAWAESLKHAYLAPSDQRDTALANVEQRAGDLLAQLKTIQPSERHAETHQHFIESMQSCVDAVSYARQGKADLSAIHGDTCTIGLTLMIDVLGDN